MKWANRFLGFLCVTCAVPGFSAGTPQLTVDYENVVSLNTGTNYYGPTWVTNASIPAYAGSTLTNYLATTSGIQTNVYRVPGTKGMILDSSSYGQPVETAVAQFQLGDVIPFPESIADTNEPPLGFIPMYVGQNATAYYMSTNPSGVAIYLPSLHQVYAAAGGNVEIEWRTTNGTLTMVYTVSDVPKLRPARIYWTEEPYNGPPITMTANGQEVFATIHYTEAVTRPTMQITSNLDAQGIWVVTTQLLDGVWFDGSGSAKQIHAVGVEGMALLEYYADGNYTRSLGVQPIQVLPPTHMEINAFIGDRLLPQDLYYGTEDLIPNITAGLGSQPKVYQVGLQGPKYNWVYAIRESVDNPWDVEIYWEHKDYRGVTWPFEVAWYEIEWPADPQHFVISGGAPQGPSIQVPDTYSVQIPYQVPANNAYVSMDQQYVSVSQGGLFLLQYSTHSNVWFQAVKAVLHNDPHYFNLSPIPCAVGHEIKPVNVGSYALQLDGLQDYGSREYVETAPSNYTLEAWFRTTTTSGGKILGFGSSTEGASGSYDRHIYMDNNGYILFGGDSGKIIVSNKYNDGVWHHVAAVCQEHGAMQLYLDGGLAGTNSTSFTTFNGYWRMGYDNLKNWPSAPSSYYFAGVVDEVRIWSVAHSGTTISNAMRQPLQGDEPGLVAYYPFEEGSGNVARDRVANKHMKLLGSPDWVAGYPLAGVVSDEAVSDWMQYPGYVYEPLGNAYNYNYYNYPTSVLSSLDSHIFPVHSNGLLEVWWANRTDDQSMPLPIYYPSRVERYLPQWPDIRGVPQIVLCSGRGSAGASTIHTETNMLVVTTNHLWALDFNGSSSYVMASNKASLAVASNFTLEAWVYPDALGDYHDLLMKGTNEYEFAIKNGNSYFFSRRQNVGYDSGKALPVGQWSHVAVSFNYDAQTLAFYLNGGCVKSTSTKRATTNEFVSTAGSGHLYLGRASTGGNGYFDGRMEEVRVWNICRSATDIASDMNTRFGGTKSGLMAYYYMEEGTGTTVADNSGQGNTAQIAGATWYDVSTYSNRYVDVVDDRLSPGLEFSADPAAGIYAQNDATKPGFNPNEEHALMLSGVAYALRNDLNNPSLERSSPPFVLVNYQATDVLGRSVPAMAVLGVVTTNEYFGGFTNSLTAGYRIQPPMPLSGMPGVDNTNSTCASGPGWRDRKLEWWAKAAGNHGAATNVIMRFWYALQDGFFFPALAVQPATGTYVPWLSGGVSGTPTNYVYAVAWPNDLPTLKLAQTLYTSPANSGLPDIHDQLSVDIVYQQSYENNKLNSVTLIDPLVRRGVYIEDEVIQQMAAAGLAVRQSPGTTYYFPDLPPSLQTRLIYDPDQSVSNRLSIIGEYVELLTDGYLLLNLVESYEYTNVLYLADALPSAVAAKWRAAVAALPTAPLELQPSQPFVKPALSAGLGQGVGYVTVAFNNSSNSAMVPTALPISLSIFKVVTNLYEGAIEVVESENPLDEKLVLRQKADFGGRADQYEFEWRTLPPTAEGLAPTSTPPAQWMLYDKGIQKAGITIQGATIQTLVDNWFITRHRPVNPSCPAGTNTWSAWVLGFGPGWINRAMNAITPFEQRLHDMTEYAVDTSADMISQAGGPYNGPVPLNMANINDFGLIEIYETILARAKMLSIDAGFRYDPADSALMLAASRLADLYSVLGNEAFADAMDPTIAFGTSDSQYGAWATSLFCFQNQLPTLLDEELCLLRGRDNSLFPPTTQGPVYNRLPWNLTRDETGGEVAYAVNYNLWGDVVGDDPVVEPEDAKAAYPQGHGDAWGYYLSAISRYYSLLRNDNFDWIPGIGSMILGGSGDLIMSVDYYDEQKFAEAAAARARTGAEIVNRTYRKFYDANPDGQFQGYRDGDNMRGWGVAEWAVRAGQATYLDWAIANSLLPETAADPSQNWALAFTNEGAYVSLGQHTLDVGSEMTLEMWVQATTLSNCALFGGSTEDWDLATPRTNLFLLMPNGRVGWYADQDRQYIYSASVVGDGLWHHIAFVYSAATSTPERAIYVDGVKEAYTPSRRVDWRKWVWTLGAYQDGPSGAVRGFFGGNLDEVRIWARALTGSDIQRNINHVLTGTEAGLIAYYPCIEGSGTVLHDKVGVNNGTLVNAGWTVPTHLLPFTNAIRGNLIATLANTNRLNHAGTYSLEAWVYHESLSNQPAIFNKSAGAGQAAQYDLEIQPGTNAAFGRCGAGGSVGAYSAGIPTGRWVHVANVVYYDASTTQTFQSLYLNGLLSATGTRPGLTPNLSSNLLIGSGWSKGMLNELRIWSKPLNAQEVQQDFRARLTGGESGLVAYYRADSVGTNQLHDLGTNGLHAALGAGVSLPSWSAALPPSPVVVSNNAGYPGILGIARSDVPELREVSANAGAIQVEMDKVDQGLNPLGLARDVVPFDINPADIDKGLTHFEQVYERAKVALQNAVAAFDYAQGATLKLRSQADSVYNMAATLADQELSFHNQLIAIFGYPYADDIGPTGTYPQGYDGPDLVNYNLLDLADLIGTAPTGQPVQLVLKNLEFFAPEAGSKDSRDYRDYVLNSEPLPGSTNVYEYADYIAKGCTVTVYVAENGLQVKPPSWTGRRQAQGSIQIALSQYIQAYYQLLQMIAQYESLQSGLQNDFNHLCSTVKRSDSEWEATDEHMNEKIGYGATIAGLEELKEILDLTIDSVTAIAYKGADNIPSITAGGAGIFSSPVAVTTVEPKAAVKLGATILHWTEIIANYGIKATVMALKAAEDASAARFSDMLSTNAYASAIKWAARDFEQSLTQQKVLQAQLFQQIQNLSQMEESYRALIAEGQRLIAQRSQIRARAAKQIQYARYFDMAFRIFRNEQLQKYGSAFNLAAQYVYLAAKAYDYETGLLSSDASRAAGSRFLSDIVRARAIGMVANGNPQVGGSTGDPGLADIMARMKANWDVLKSRFGFNNPETEISRFSLRTELLRTTLASAGDASWQNALNSMYRVNSLYDVPEFKRYCKPFSTTTNREPALVIPFETTISSRRNFFNRELAGGDGAYDPSHAATKIRSAGVWFFNYNGSFTTNATGGGLASEPRVYLVPAGYDIQRSPTDVDAWRLYSVVDQAMPIPYPISAADLTEPEWVAVNDSLSGSLADIRRFPAMRAYSENDLNKYTQDEGYIDPAQMISNSRLVGRSVWNTRWLLIIPGSTLLSDPDEGLNRFIFGAGTGSGPAQRDGNGVKDIRILFHTYSIPGE